MNLRPLFIGVLLASIGCSGNGSSGMDMSTDVDMRMSKPTPDMKKAGACDENGTKPVGSACGSSTKCDCSGPKPNCLTQLALGMTTLDLPGGYCSNKSCVIGQEADTCGDSGVCADLAGDGTLACYQRCTKGACRAPDYACINVAQDPNNPMSKVVPACLPKDMIVQCDPTADPMTQCTKVGGTDVSTLTNGFPGAYCARIGKDPVGECRYLPCQIGPGNCPASGTGGPQGCVYFDAVNNTRGGDPADKWKGPLCLPLVAAAMQKKVGDTCMYLNECVDNSTCYGGAMATCKQNCFNGTQPSYPGGQMKYKNPASACPGGTKCTNVYNLSGDNWTGLCM